MDAPYTLEPGDCGVILRADGTIDLLVPPGQEDDTLLPMHSCLLGATIGVATDADFRARALQTLAVYRDADGGPEEEGH